MQMQKNCNKILRRCKAYTPPKESFDTQEARGVGFIASCLYVHFFQHLRGRHRII